MTGYDFQRPFADPSTFATYTARDAEVGSRYGQTVKAFEMSNSEYGLRYKRLHVQNKMKPPPSHQRIFSGFLVLRSLGSHQQYETWMPDDVFEDLYLQQPFA